MQGLFICFTDYEKDILQCHVAGFRDAKDLLLLSELYWNQSVVIRTEGDLGRWIIIVKGARQGCVTSTDFLTHTYRKDFMSS